jgi:hypothetical protein
LALLWRGYIRCENLIVDLLKTRAVGEGQASALLLILSFAVKTIFKNKQTFSKCQFIFQILLTKINWSKQMAFRHKTKLNERKIK